MNYSLLLCFVCALLYVQLSEQDPTRPNVECNVGFVGISCEISCRYPSFGNNCQSQCNCHEDYCDPVTGCKDGSPTFSSPVSISSVKTNSIEFSTRNKKECPAGYTGNGCDIRCRYPAFGYFCQLMCNCSKERCNFANGCDDCSEGNNGSECEKPCQYPAFGGRCQSKCNCSEKYCDPLKGCNVSSPHCASEELTQNEAMFYITIVLGVWAAFQCLIYFCLSCGLVSCYCGKRYHVIV